MKRGRLAVLGAGGHGRVVADAASEAGWMSIEFFDDSRVGSSGEWVVRGSSSDLLAEALNYDGVVVAIGDNVTRLQWTDRLVSNGAALETIIHPRATVSKSAEIGLGTVVMAGAVINYGVRMGKACIVNTSASVDHDCVLGDAVHVSPGATLSGDVSVGSKVWIGTGAAIKNAIVIGDEAIIGLGSAVIQKVSRRSTVVGVPAKARGAKNE